MSNRTYSQAFNDGKAAPSFQYLFDPNILTTGQYGIITGGFRPFAISDVASVSVSGLSVSVNSVAITGNPVVTLTGNQQVIINNNIIPISGIVQPIFTGNVFTQSAGNSTASNNTVSGNYGTSVLPININRHQWFMQNLGTGVLFVNYSASLPNTGSMNLLLKGGNSQFDGLGASYSDDAGIYRGAISISGIIPNPLYTIWDL